MPLPRVKRRWSVREKMADAAYVYVLLCEDGPLYPGWTTDVEKRFAAHCSGRGARYTRAHRPVRVVYQEGFATKREAMRREAAVKKLSRAEKQRLCGLE